MTENAITSDISAALLTGIRTLFGNRLQRVESYPGPWSDAAVHNLINNAPAVYVAWLGARINDVPNTVISQWGIFISANVLNGRPTDSVGTAHIMERITAWLHGRIVAPAGRFSLTHANNLWSESQATSGRTVYSLYFDAPQALPAPIVDSDIHDYATHYQAWAVSKGTPEQEALIHLPIQEPKNG